VDQHLFALSEIPRPLFKGLFALIESFLGRFHLEAPVFESCVLTIAICLCFGSPLFLGPGQDLLGFLSRFRNN
jgi:hypothetical protein